MLSRIRYTGPGASCMSFFRNSTNTVTSNRPTKTSNFTTPAGDTAEIMFTPPASSGDLDHRRLPDRRPRGARVTVSPYPRLIAEEQLSTLGPSLLPDCRELVVGPPAHRVRILLVGAAQRPLRRQPEAPQQLPDPLRSHLDPEFLLDQLPGDRACPQRAVKLKLPRIA